MNYSLTIPVKYANAVEIAYTYINREGIALPLVFDHIFQLHGNHGGIVLPTDLGAGEDPGG